MNRARELDLEFLTTVTKYSNVAEYGGHIAKVAREQNQIARPANVTRHRRLMDLTPADPSNIKTALIEGQTITSDCGQNFVVFTADQQ